MNKRTKIFLAVQVFFALWVVFSTAKADVIQPTGATGEVVAWKYDTGQQYDAQSFKATADGTITQVQAMNEKQGSPTGNYYVTIEADTAGQPSNAPLSTSDNQVDVSTLGTCAGASYDTFTFSSPASVTSGTTYWLVYRPTGSNSTSNFITACGATSNVYADGAEAYGSATHVFTNETADLNVKITITTTGGGGGGGSTSTAATSTEVDSPGQDLFYAFCLYFMGMAFMIWLMRGK